MSSGHSRLAGARAWRAAHRICDVRTGLRPAALLSTVGVVVSAAITRLAAAWLLGRDWGRAMLLGAIVASTSNIGLSLER